MGHFSSDFNLEACLFLGLSLGSHFGGFSRLDPPSRKDPDGDIPSFDEEDLGLGLIKYHATDRF